MEIHQIAKATVENIVVSNKTIWRHVVLETDSGLTGIGEASLDGASAGFDDALLGAARALCGRRVDDAILAPLAVLLDHGLEQRTIHSALDQAVCDLSAKIAGVTVAALLGQPTGAGAIPLYANINRTSVDRHPDAIAKNAALAAKEGFVGIKLAAFDGLSPELCGTPAGEDLIAAGLARLRAMAAAAPGAEIMVDCHWRFQTATALDLIPTLAEIGVTWFECPLPETADQIENLRSLRAAANGHGMRLCGLETHGDWDDVAPFVTAGAYDVIMPDVKHAGGLRTIAEIARRAAVHDVAVSLHNPSGPVAHAASLQTAAAIGGAERLEHQWHESDMFFSITNPAPVIQNGQAVANDRTGLGTALKTALRKETLVPDSCQ